MINEKAFSYIPDGGILINSARGSLVDMDALIAELSTGRIRAAIDVFEKGASRRMKGFYGVRTRCSFHT